MNFYPNNFYQPNYPYSGTTGYSQYSQSLTQPSQPQVAPAVNNQYAGIQGKIVDGEDVVRATEVPFGGYGVFPKADLGEVYIKTWNSDGTTKIITYKPIVAQTTDDKGISTQDLILSKMQEIEKKLDAITERYVPSTSTVGKEILKEGKEAVANAY